MSLLFSISVLLGFILWFAASLPGSRVPEWSARLSFMVAALIWALPHFARLG